MSGMELYQRKGMSDHDASHSYWSRQQGCVSVPPRVVTLPPDDDPYTTTTPSPNPPVVPPRPQVPTQLAPPKEDANKGGNKFPFVEYLRERHDTPANQPIQRPTRSCMSCFVTMTASISTMIVGSVSMVL